MTAVSIETLVMGLAARAEELCRELLPGGRREGPEWKVGSLAGEPGKSMAVHLTGAKAGIWSDFAAGIGGDALSLVAEVLFHGDVKEAIKWARVWLGYGSDEKRLQETRRRIAAKPKAEDRTQNLKRQRAKAKSLFLSAQAQLIGTPVEHYLAGRGIQLKDLPRLPGSIRFHPTCYDGETKSQLPAMLGCVTDGHGILTVHRTFLCERPGGHWQKAKLSSPKKVLGPYRGGMIPINRGASGKPFAQMPEGETLAITEGIEDALTLALAVPELRVMASVSLGNLSSVALPAQVREVAIFADNDPEGTTAAKALDKAMQNLLARGLAVRLHLPDKNFKDFNEWLLALRKSEGAA